MIVAMKNFVKRSRPKRYMARDAAYPVGGHPGIYFASRPSPYPITTQQRKVRNVAAECGIKKGMKKAPLQLSMRDCVGPKMRKS